MLTVEELESIRTRLTRLLAPPPNRYRPMWVEGNVAGWLDDARASRLTAWADVFDVRDCRVTFVPGLDDAPVRSAALDFVVRALAAEGLLTAWRDERYAVAPEFGAAPWFFVERAAARFFGIETHAAHVNGVVRRDGEVMMWLARRSATKSIDPGMLDNLVGGGLSAGQSVAQAVVKEAWEEAGIDASLATRAKSAGVLRIFREQPDGLQRETIFAHDLWLPADFVPAGQDGEVDEHRLVPLADAARLIANETGHDVVTADASLVVLDFLLRHAAIAPDAHGHSSLYALRQAPRSFAR